MYVKKVLRKRDLGCECVLYRCSNLRKRLRVENLINIQFLDINYEDIEK